MMTSGTRRSLAAGLAVLVFLELGARVLAPHLPGPLTWDTEFSQSKAEQIHDLGKVDLVVIGSSIVNAGLDGPTIVGEVPWAISGYNAGLPSTTPRTWEVWANDLVFSELCPDVLMVGLSIRDVNDNNPGAESRRYAYSNSAGRLKLFGAAPTGRSIEERVGEWSAFVRIRPRLSEPGNVIKYLVTGSVGSWPDPALTSEGRYQGFDDNVYFRSEAGDEGLRTGALGDFRMGGAEFDSIREIVRKAQSAGSTVVLMEMPAMRSHLRDVVPVGKLDDFSEQLDSLGDELEVPVWHLPEFDDRVEIFADIYHPNGWGAHEISLALGLRLAAEYPDGVSPAACQLRGSSG